MNPDILEAKIQAEANSYCDAQRTPDMDRAAVRMAYMLGCWKQRYRQLWREMHKGEEERRREHYEPPDEDHRPGGFDNRMP